MRGEIPKGWVNTSLEQVVLHKKGKKPKETIPNPRDGYVPYILIDEMEGKTVRAFTNDEKVPIANEDDVLIVWDGSIGKTATGMRGAIGSTIAALSPIVIKPHFLNAFLQLSKPEIQQTSRGTGLQHINPTAFWPLEFPLPPLNEQKRIAAKLDHIITKIDAVKERLERIPQIIKRFRQSVLTAAVTGKLTEKWREEHPDVESAKTYSLSDAENAITDVSLDYMINEITENWNWVKIGNIADVKGGKRVPKGEKLVRKDTGYPYIKAGNLKNGTVIDSNIEYLTPSVREKIRRYTVNTGDLYITNVGACIGDAGIIPVKFDYANLTENAVKICNLCDFIFNEYLSVWLRSPLCQGYIQNTILSAAQGKLALGRVKSLPVPLPPLEEQREIVRQADKLFDFTDKLEEHYKKAKEKIDRLPQSVLAKTFRGELVPQDPNDEPAEKLLERIKDEKVRLEAEMKKTRRKVTRKKQ